MKRTPKQVFLTEISRQTGLKESDFNTIVEYQCKTPGKYNTSVVGEVRGGKLFIAENGFLRQYQKRNGHWTCKVLGRITF